MKTNADEQRHIRIPLDDVEVGDLLWNDSVCSYVKITSVSDYVVMKKMDGTDQEYYSYSKYDLPVIYRVKPSKQKNETEMKECWTIDDAIAEEEYYRELASELTEIKDEDHYVISYLHNVKKGDVLWHSDNNCDVIVASNECGVIRLTDGSEFTIDGHYLNVTTNRAILHTFNGNTKQDRKTEMKTNSDEQRHIKVPLDLDGYEVPTFISNLSGVKEGAKLWHLSKGDVTVSNVMENENVIYIHESYDIFDFNGYTKSKKTDIPILYLKKPEKFLKLLEEAKRTIPKPPVKKFVGVFCSKKLKHIFSIVFDKEKYVHEWLEAFGVENDLIKMIEVERPDYE